MPKQDRGPILSKFGRIITDTRSYKEQIEELTATIEPLEISEIIRVFCDILNRKRWGRITDVSRMFMIVGQLERVHVQLYPETFKRISPLDAPKNKVIVEGAEQIGAKEAEALKLKAVDVLQRLTNAATKAEEEAVGGSVVLIEH